MKWQLTLSSSSLLTLSIRYKWVMLFATLGSPSGLFSRESIGEADHSFASIVLQSCWISKTDKVLKIELPYFIAMSLLGIYSKTGMLPRFSHVHAFYCFSHCNTEMKPACTYIHTCIKRWMNNEKLVQESSRILINYKEN